MTSHLETVRQAVIKAVPSVMELKFGCEVYCEQGWEDDTGAYHDEYGTATGAPDDEGTCMVLTNSTDERGDRMLLPMLPTEILGRPIRLFDIKLLLEYNGYAVEQNFTEIAKAWRSPDNLENQSQEVLNLISKYVQPQR